MLPFTPFTAPEHQDFLLQGGRPAALLVHGYPGTPFEMHPLAEELNECGWTCRGILLPGFGIQLETLPKRTWPEWRDAVLEALTSLQHEHAPILLVGHSMGAAVGLLAAACFPLDGLVLLAPFCRPRGLLWMLMPVLKHLVPRIKPFRMMKTERDDPRLRVMIRDFFPELNLDNPQVQESIREFVVPVAMFDELRRVGVAGYRSAPYVSCPTLVIQGAQDATVHPKDTRRLAGRLAGAVTRIEVPGAHELVFAASPSFPRVREALLAFAEETLRKPG